VPCYSTKYRPPSPNFLHLSRCRVASFVPTGEVSGFVLLRDARIEDTVHPLSVQFGDNLEKQGTTGMRSLGTLGFGVGGGRRETFERRKIGGHAKSKSANRRLIEDSRSRSAQATCMGCMGKSCRGVAANEPSDASGSEKSTSRSNIASCQFDIRHTFEQWLPLYEGTGTGNPSTNKFTSRRTFRTGCGQKHRNGLAPEKGCQAASCSGPTIGRRVTALAWTNGVSPSRPGTRRVAADAVRPWRGSPQIFQST
jgi:hypothetical protein